MSKIPEKRICSIQIPFRRLKNCLQFYLPEIYDNPIDNIIINICKHLAPSFKKLAFTPNKLTTLSVLFTILCIKFLFERKYKLAALCYLINYFFDCFDGYYARNYNMTSKLGYYYDHITDIMGNLIIFCIIFNKYRKVDNIYKYFPIIAIILFITANMHLGCRDRYYNEINNIDNKGTLSISVCRCPKGDTKKYLNILRHFGSASYVMFIALLIFIVPLVDK